MRFQIKFIISFLLLIFCTNIYSQHPYYLPSIPFVKGNREIRNPWMGGFNNPQFSSMRINDDTLNDLFVFDRSDDKVLTFINNGKGGDSCYIYKPEYEKLFPIMFSWALIKDYNKDGIGDIFTRTNGGIKVYKGKRVSGQLGFDLVNPLITYPYNNLNVNLYCASPDIPAFADVNGDGDLDILVFPIIGTTVEYYENQKIETGTPFDSLKYEFVSGCWGGFYEAGLGNNISMGACKNEGNPIVNISADDGFRDGNHTLLAYDIEKDGDQDLFIGATAYSNILFTKNCGSITNAEICNYDSLWPRYNNTLAVDFFPSAFLVNIDANGKDDFIFSTNSRQAAADKRNVFWYEKNSNIPGDSTFSFISDSFLISDQLDFGTDSKVSFLDYNTDGKLDIVVGILGFYQGGSLPLKSQIAVLENIGTPSVPKFRERSLNFGNLAQYNLKGLSPTFGDLDGDGNVDLVVGDENGQMHFFKNQGSSIVSFPSITEPILDTIDVGLNATPFLYDFNGDSLLDLVVGNKLGRLNYYPNYGTATNYQFYRDSVNTFFGGIDVKLIGFPQGMSHPFVEKANDSVFLYVGSDIGQVFKCLVDTTKLRSGTFAVIDSNSLGNIPGARSNVAIADINNDGFKDYMVGVGRGGIYFYSDTLIDSFIVIGLEEETIDKSSWINIYPNPTKNSVEIYSSDSELVYFEINDVMGRKVNSGSLQNILKLDLSGWAKGFYVMSFRFSNGERISKALIKE